MCCGNRLHNKVRRRRPESSEILYGVGLKKGAGLLFRRHGKCAISAGSKVLAWQTWVWYRQAISFEYARNHSYRSQLFGEASHHLGTSSKPRVRRKQRTSSSMSTLHFRRVERRRTARVTVFADLTVQGISEQNQKFKIRTRSLSVSGHGGLTVLDVPVSVGQTILLMNDNSREKAECRVVSTQQGGNGKTIVAFEFVTPPANFWKMSFPPVGAKLPRRALPSAASA